MRKIFIKFFTLFLFFVFIFPCYAEAQRKTILDFKDKLSLTEEQVLNIRKIIDDFEAQAKPLREKIVSLDREIRKLLEEGGDIEDIKKKIKEVFSIRADLTIKDIEAGRKIDGVLTPEQLTKWREIRKIRR